MTGFGTGSAEEEGIRVRAVLRSVNGRFLDLSVRCPGPLQELEPRVRERLQGRLTRGKVTGTIDCEETGESNGRPELDPEIAERYLSELDRLARETGLPPVGLEVVARMPGVFRTSSRGPDPERLERLVMEALDQALAELEEMRRSEGAALAADLRARLATIDGLTDRIEELALEGREEARRRLREKVEGLLKPGEMDEDRLATEIVLIAERSDITEEIVRLRSHHERFLEAIDKGGEVGRRLNFLLQEMHREINTLSSKSAAGGIVHGAVAAKEEVERLREQVQNLA
jgi:uncharacterized protein (TIGR00255 family)